MDSLYHILDEVSPLWGVCDFSLFKDCILSCRAAKRIPENASRVIVTLFPYYLGEDAYEGSNISRYAAVPDYNDFMKDRLSEACQKLRTIYPNDSFEPFCGNSPLPEVYAAQKAGLGSKGKNGLLLTERYGSWVFIGEIITSLPLEVSDCELNLCNGCDKCIKACPTGALKEDGFDADICLSAVSQQKAPLTAEQEDLIRKSGCAWGCDVCQKACPKNIGAEKTEIDLFLSGAKVFAEHDECLDGRAYGWRGKKVIERNLTILDNAGGES